MFICSIISLNRPIVTTCELLSSYILVLLPKAKPKGVVVESRSAIIAIYYNLSSNCIIKPYKSIIVDL